MYTKVNIFIFISFFIIVFFQHCNKAESQVTRPLLVPVPIVSNLEKEPVNSSAVEYYGALKVTGNKITGKDNSPVQLRGMSFFWSQWMGKYYNNSCVKWLKDDWYCNVVRAAMAIEEGGYLTNPDFEKKKVFDVVDAAIANGLYVIIDWHDHHATDHLQEAKKFFAEVAQKYGDKPNIIYEPFNEPLQISWSSAIKPYHQAIIDTIRHHDPDNLIICGTPTWSQDVDIAANDPLAGINIAYALHFYSGTHKQSLRDKAKNALNKGVALMVTEFGTTDASGDGFVNQAETNLWFSFMDENKLSWCNWSVADKTENSASLLAGSSANGSWLINQLSASGTFIRTEMKVKNLRFK
jgi:endoglucanase